MKEVPRYIENSIIKDALNAKKIAFISGPRQVGKTTLAKHILENKNSGENYFSFDDDEFKKIWIKNPKSILQNLDIKDHPLIVFDEIHKDHKWKNKLKGLYDLYNKEAQFIVTGSARLNFFRKSGDSLQGRYIPYHLHPFTFGEVSHVKPPPEIHWDENFGNSIFNIKDLLSLGGFPDPLLGGSLNKARRFQRLYRERLIREDLRDLSNVRDINLLSTMSLLLIEKAGGQLSFESLRQDLSTSFDSVARWINLLEAVYFMFMLRPYCKNIKNSLKKEPKCFLYDWSVIKDEGKRLENMIAMHLLKNVHVWTDLAYGEFELFYLRDKQKHEVDFLITRDQKPYLLLEVKTKNSNISSSLIHFKRQLNPTFSIQLVLDKKEERKTSLLRPQIEVMGIEKFLGSIN